MSAPEIGGEYYLGSALPVGACSSASTCHLVAVAQCPCGGYSGTLDYDCTCVSGTWACALVAKGATGCNCLENDGGAGSDAGAGGAPVGDGGPTGVTLPACAPGILASVVLTPDVPTHHADAVVVDDGAIYVGIGSGTVSSQGSVIALSSDGASVRTLYETDGPFEVAGLALAGGSVFVSAGGGAGGILLGVPVGDGAPVGAPTMGDGVPLLASDGVQVYYWQWGPDVLSAGAHGSPGHILHTSLFTLPGASGAVERLAVAGTDVFVQVSAGFPPAVFTIERGSTGGGTTTTIATTATAPVSLAADDAYVFWSEPGNPADGTAPAVKRAAHDGSGVEVLAALRATSLAADGSRLFLTTTDAVVQIDLPSKTSTTIATAQTAPSAITQQGARVYWLNDAPGSGGPGVANAVMSACKP